MSNKTALVTGASAGLGKAIAKELSQSGYQLILVARRLERLQALQQTLSTPSHIIAADLSDHDAIESALRDLPMGFKSIDLLVNNAGLALGITTSNQTDWGEWQTMIDTNVTALAFLTPTNITRHGGAKFRAHSKYGIHRWALRLQRQQHVWSDKGFC